MGRRGEGGLGGEGRKDERLGGAGEGKLPSHPGGSNDTGHVKMRGPS
jgi:hypothetical protein